MRILASLIELRALCSKQFHRTASTVRDVSLIATLWVAVGAGNRTLKPLKTFIDETCATEFAGYGRLAGWNIDFLWT